MPSTDHQLLAQLFRDCRKDLLAFLFGRLGCAQTAADLCQESFLRLWRSGDLSRIGNPRAYLFRTALNLITDYHRSGKTRFGLFAELNDTDEDDSASLPVEERTGETATLASEQLDRATAALQELPPLSQRIFYLSRFEGLKQREIAERLGVSLRTVEEHLKRTLLHLNRRVHED
ncbi:RNA polymerase, sigma-24 subunit, ECF subfamily [Methylocaldum marinum]|uniref:RNA polymerase, sigma-24 subunit, ECF subfamily n=1 Tax=Methylocaldum marinum TaxID=1432792 RepID=A0A286P3D2_9GAMM|nr:RNA polymerase sigma factor [Methylocaldum marinum]BBA32154.1 RNA polymerase, sigma-24 subunit, ECF subfamily [Methylocaldum marinum]